MPRLLLVDDNPSVLAGLSSVLRTRRRDFEIVLALDAEEAREQLTKGPFDAIVCDIRLPGPSGDVLLEYVQMNFPATRRIVLSGLTNPGAIARIQSLCDRFLEKPCDPDTVYGAISSLIEQR